MALYCDTSLRCIRLTQVPLCFRTVTAQKKLRQRQKTFWLIEFWNANLFAEHTLVWCTAFTKLSSQKHPTTVFTIAEMYLQQEFDLGFECDLQPHQVQLCISQSYPSKFGPHLMWTPPPVWMSIHQHHHVSLS